MLKTRRAALPLLFRICYTLHRPNKKIRDRDRSRNTPPKKKKKRNNNQKKKKVFSRRVHPFLCVCVCVYLLALQSLSFIFTVKATFFFFCCFSPLFFPLERSLALLEALAFFLFLGVAVWNLFRFYLLQEQEEQEEKNERTVIAVVRVCVCRTFPLPLLFFFVIVIEK